MKDIINNIKTEIKRLRADIEEVNYKIRVMRELNFDIELKYWNNIKGYIIDHKVDLVNIIDKLEECKNK